MDTEDRDHFKTIASRLPAPLGGSPRQHYEGNSPSDLDPAYCLMRAKLMFSCYRKDEAHDPEIYAAAVAAMLASYPRQVVERTTDPRTGIASESKWLPSVFEVREFCDRVAERLAKMASPRRKPIPPTPYVRPAPGKSFVEMFEANGRALGPFEESGDKWNRR